MPRTSSGFELVWVCYTSRRAAQTQALLRLRPPAFHHLQLLSPASAVGIAAPARSAFARAGSIRKQYTFAVIGYVVMPEHVHLLLGEPETRNISVAIKALKQSIARRVLRALRKQTSQIELFAAGPPLRFWQARFYDFNVWSSKKLTEKLRYMHRNPVKRGLVLTPDVALVQFSALCLRRERTGGDQCHAAARLAATVACRCGIESQTNKLVWGPIHLRVPAHKREAVCLGHSPSIDR